MAIRGHVSGCMSRIGRHRVDMDAVDECLSLSVDTMHTYPWTGQGGGGASTASTVLHTRFMDTDRVHRSVQCSRVFVVENCSPLHKTSALLVPPRPPCNPAPNVRPVPPMGGGGGLAQGLGGGGDGHQVTVPPIGGGGNCKGVRGGGGFGTRPRYLGGGGGSCANLCLTARNIGRETQPPPSYLHRWSADVRRPVLTADRCLKGGPGTY